MRKNPRFEPDYVSGCTALCTVCAWLVTTFAGVGLHLLLPDFDGLPLLLLLWGVLVLACIVNRVAAQVFARNHFGMPPEERRALLERHAAEVKADPLAVMAKYEGMTVTPAFLLGLYFFLVSAISALFLTCVHEGASVGRIVLSGLTAMASLGLFAMAFYRIFSVVFTKKLNKDALVPVGALPRLEALAKKAADEAGIKGHIRLELTRDCDCDVNVFGKTYVVFFGTRLLSVCTEEELYQCLLASFDYFSRPQEYRRVLRAHRLGELGGAEIRPATFVFDRFFSYADATLEWEYDLYITAYKAYIDREANRRLLEQGNPAAAVGAMAKRAMWRHFTFEASDHLTKPFYYEEKLHDHFERDVCDAYRRALSCRREVWLDMLSREFSTDRTQPNGLFTECWKALTPDADAPASADWTPDLTTPYGQEVTAAVAMVDARIRRELSHSYTAYRKREYLEPLATVEAYEKNPTGYTTPELSPVINAYRDICEYDKAEAVCDSILETETNQFALAHALYFKGMQMLHRYDVCGIDHIYRAIDLNKNYMKDGFELVEEYCSLCGLEDEYETYLRRADIQYAAHAYNHNEAGELDPRDHLVKEEELGDMLPDILAYMEQVSEGCIREIYLVRKVISEDFFSSVFVLNLEYGADREAVDRAYTAIFNYLDAYPVDWQFSLFLYDRRTEAAVKRVEGSLVWTKSESNV